jgi:hypothetical protein
LTPIIVSAVGPTFVNVTLFEALVVPTTVFGKLNEVGLITTSVDVPWMNTVCCGKLPWYI